MIGVSRLSLLALALSAFALGFAIANLLCQHTAQPVYSRHVYSSKNAEIDPRYIYTAQGVNESFAQYYRWIDAIDRMRHDHNTTL